MHDENAELRVLALGEEKPHWHAPGLHVVFRAFEFASDPDAAAFDAAMVSVRCAAELQAEDVCARLQRLAMEAALIVIAPGMLDIQALSLLKIGVQDVLTEPKPVQVVRAIRFAVERRRQQQAARLAYATDLATGLPHQEQLLEYISQLIALRAREPAALVLIVLRIEGSMRLAGQLGQQGAQILRRKLAVRLRAALRASDVVASIGSDMFGVLLGHVESAADGHTVVGKLVDALRQPVSLAGQPFEVAVAAGMAHWPEHGRDPLELLRRAKAQAASTAALGPKEGFGSALERLVGVAANDEALGS